MLEYVKHVYRAQFMTNRCFNADLTARWIKYLITQLKNVYLFLLLVTFINITTRHKENASINRSAYRLKDTTNLAESVSTFE